MKKRLLAVLMVGIVWLTGCQSKDYTEYRDAMKQTSSLDRYEERFRLDVAMDYDLDAVEDEELAMRISEMADFSVEAISKEDRERGLVEAEAHIFYGGIGFDADYYVTEEGSYLSLPFIEQYIRIDSAEMGTFKPEEYGLLISEPAMMEIREIWLDMVTDDEVFKGEEILVDTPDGKVKTSKFTIQISDEIFKLFLGEIAQVVMMDDVFMENLASQDLPEGFEMMKMLEYVESTHLDQFIQEVYVDVDGYIVKETMTIDGSSTDDFFRGFHFEMKSELYGINQEMSFDFPEFDESNLMSFDELEDTQEWQDFTIEQ